MKPIIHRKTEMPCKYCGQIIVFYSHPSGKRFTVDVIDGKKHHCPKTESSEDKQTT